MLEEMFMKNINCSPLLPLRGNRDITSNKKQTNNEQFNHICDTPIIS